MRTYVQWQWDSEHLRDPYAKPTGLVERPQIETFDSSAQAKRWIKNQVLWNSRHPDEAQIVFLHTNDPSVRLPAKYTQARRSR